MQKAPVRFACRLQFLLLLVKQAKAIMELSHVRGGVLLGLERLTVIANRIVLVSLKGISLGERRQAFRLQTGSRRSPPETCRSTRAALSRSARSPQTVSLQRTSGRAPSSHRHWRGRWRGLADMPAGLGHSVPSNGADRRGKSRSNRSQEGALRFVGAGRSPRDTDPLFHRWLPVGWAPGGGRDRDVRLFDIRTWPL